VSAKREIKLASCTSTQSVTSALRNWRQYICQGMRHSALPLRHGSLPARYHAKWGKNDGRRNGFFDRYDYAKNARRLRYKKILALAQKQSVMIRVPTRRMKSAKKARTGYRSCFLLKSGTTESTRPAAVKKQNRKPFGRIMPLTPA
jgi:hypothetical protein